MRVTVNGQAQQQLVQANTAGSGRTPNPKTTSSVGSPARAEDYPAMLRKRRIGVA